MVEIQPFTFDFKGFQAVLEDEARAIFEVVRAEWERDGIYACGFVAHSEEFEHLYPLVFTRAYLNRRIKRERRSDYQRFKGMSLANLRWYYRYRYPLDYDQIDFLSKAFAQSNRLIAEGGASLLGMWIDAAGKLTTKHADEMVKPQLTRFRATCINVLRKLNREGVFGRGDARTKRVLMIDYTAYPDYDPAGRIIGALNPAEIVNRYRIEMAKASSFDMQMRQNEDNE